MLRNAPIHLNPYPAVPEGVRRDTHFIPASMTKPADPVAADLVVLAVQRKEQDLPGKTELAVGDTLLRQGPWAALDYHLDDSDVLVVDRATFPSDTMSTHFIQAPGMVRLARWGLQEKVWELEERGIAIETMTSPLHEVDRAVLDGEDEGFLRLHVKKGSDLILGATLVAEHAGDMIGELAQAIPHKIGLGKIASTIHPYPTQGEVVKKAADAWRRHASHPKGAIAHPNSRDAHHPCSHRDLSDDYEKIARYKI